MKTENILIVEDADTLRESLSEVLTAQGWNVTLSATAEDALSQINSSEFSLVLSDLKLPGLNGLDLVREARKMRGSLPIVVMTAYGSIDIAVEAMKLGAIDFITKPFSPSALINILEQIAEHRRIIDRSTGRTARRQRSFITQNEVAQEMLDHARKVAPLSSPVLLLGESGTGKELIARYIHEHSHRSASPFIGINCGSMPSELLESEFFGHEAGAFTGATEPRSGLFEVGHMGTIFLDEIGNMPTILQTKLLRTLQESEIKRLGSTKFKKIDVRIVSATNANLKEAISAGAFREDLFYRLGVVALEIPPLRERPEDILLLANYFLKSLCHEFSIDIPEITPEAKQVLSIYHWPGNVRELENAIERALIFSDKALTPASFNLMPGNQNSVKKNADNSLHTVVQENIRSTETDLITKVLNRTHGNKAQAAKILGVSYKTLLNKIKDYELEPI